MYFWQPTPSQELLLEACLLSDELGANALSKWLASVDLQRLEPGCFRLLPLLAPHLNSYGIDHEFRAVIKGVYRRTWYHNQLLLARAKELSKGLFAQGIPVMALKGAALTLRNYRDIGARPMRDLDLVVPTQHARKAVEFFYEAGWLPEPTPLAGTMTPTDEQAPGWRPGPRPIDAFNACYFAVRHAHGFKDHTGIGIDLHWHLFQGDCNSDSDQHVWNSSGAGVDPADWILFPKDHEHLVLILAHASRWNPVPSIRWVADAVKLLRTSQAFDWDGFCSIAIRRCATLHAKELLSYLNGRFHVEIPDQVLRHLRNHVETKVVRSAYRQSVSRPTLFSGVAELRYLYSRYRLLRREEPNTCQASFPQFMCDILGADNPWQLAGYIRREVSRRSQSIR